MAEMEHKPKQDPQLAGPRVAPPADAPMAPRQIVIPNLGLGGAPGMAHVNAHPGMIDDESNLPPGLRGLGAKPAPKPEPPEGNTYSEIETKKAKQPGDPAAGSYESGEAGVKGKVGGVDVKAGATAEEGGEVGGKLEAKKKLGGVEVGGSAKVAGTPGESPKVSGEASVKKDLGKGVKGKLGVQGSASEKEQKAGVVLGVEF